MAKSKMSWKLKAYAAVMRIFPPKRYLVYYTATNADKAEKVHGNIVWIVYRGFVLSSDALREHIAKTVKALPESVVILNLMRI